MRKQKRIIVLLCFAVCLLSITACGFLVNNLLQHDKSPDTSLQTTPVSSADVSSATDPTVSDTSQITDATNASSAQTVTAEQRTAALSSLDDSISSLLDEQSGRYSVYYLNLANGETLGCNETAPMVAASSIKIAYNTYLYKQAAAGVLSMDEIMQYNASEYPAGDFEAGTGTIQNSASGTEYSLSTLSDLSIRISDNCATNMILRYLGGEDVVNSEYMSLVSAVVNYRTSVSYTDYTGTEQSGKRRTSATDLTMYAKDLYDLSVASPDAYAVLIEDLCTTEYQWGIPAGVPDTCKVAHKVGFNPTYGSNNDVGIVFAEEDYILCVMTESGDAANAQDVIGQVSELVYSYITSCYS